MGGTKRSVAPSIKIINHGQVYHIISSVDGSIRFGSISSKTPAPWSWCVIGSVPRTRKLREEAERRASRLLFAAGVVARHGIGIRIRIRIRNPCGTHLGAGGEGPPGAREGVGGTRARALDGPEGVVVVAAGEFLESRRVAGVSRHGGLRPAKVGVDGQVVDGKVDADADVRDRGQGGCQRVGDGDDRGEVFLLDVEGPGSLVGADPRVLAPDAGADGNGVVFVVGAALDVGIAHKGAICSALGQGGGAIDRVDHHFACGSLSLWFLWFLWFLCPGGIFGELRGVEGARVPDSGSPGVHVGLVDPLAALEKGLEKVG
ncbi:unnamed protein product [Pseudo-nitzschia multistriata]|uniref:Uncharacterized protein n=1 Tax=Pseudo-nitzschia multistriata TaxID=183589 RepID=A0A448ZQR6_9STRA|nr:unnamed protein product [Pseudo-nitzschia multistriata]